MVGFGVASCVKHKADGTHADRFALFRRNNLRTELSVSVVQADLLNRHGTVDHRQIQPPQKVLKGACALGQCIIPKGHIPRFSLFCVHRTAESHRTLAVLEKAVAVNTLEIVAVGKQIGNVGLGRIGRIGTAQFHIKAFPVLGAQLQGHIGLRHFRHYILFPIDKAELV